MLRRCARDHLQIGDPRQARQNLVLNAVGKIRIGFFFTEVFKGKHRDAFFRRSQGRARAEFLETRIISQWIKHRIEPEQRRSKRRVAAR